jgi:TatD DNase family protein
MKYRLPALDGHAHIAPDVTPAQARLLGDSYTFAVTRSLSEAEHVRDHPARTIMWGIGTHPGVGAARQSYDEKKFARLLPSFGLVGEIGLDKRGGDASRQTEILSSILKVCTDEPVLLSVHSSGRPQEILDLLYRFPQRGTILHWWTSDGSELDAAVQSGSYFSVNSAMPENVLRRIPQDRLITETDFPARRVGARRPGDTSAIESQLADILGLTEDVVRQRVWANLQQLVNQSGASERLPEALSEKLSSI